MERAHEFVEEAGPQGDPAMIAAISPPVTPRKERERLAEYLK
jgi:hypothetical protein